MPSRQPVRTACRGASALALAIACGWAGPLAAGPKGGVVTHGDAAIRAGGKVTAIQQSSDRIIIDWQSFDVGADETVRFEQPDARSIALNRVAAGAASRIDGAIEANGNVWLVNPSGVMFGQGARVDVGGLIVSTADISDQNFINGNMVFDRPGDPGAQIVNDGEITFAEAGLAGFVAPEMINRGRIAGRLGRITIAGKDSFSVDISGDGMFALDLSDAAPAAHARLVNDGVIDAAGGVVVMDAASVRDAVDGTVSVGGVVSAVSADVDGGKIILTGDLVHLQDGALVDASGARDGGIVRIGAAAPDAAPLPARRTLIAAGAMVRADGGAGSGGDVLVWGQDAAMVRGAISAKGGAGGRIEISSPGAVRFDGAADAGGGLVLFDPTFLTIGALGTDDTALSDSQFLAGEGASSSFISAATLNGMSGTVLLQASDTIRVDQDVAFGGNLTLEAGRDILLFADIAATGALRLEANAPVTGAPAITNGSIRIDAGRSIAAGGALTLLTGIDGRLEGGAMPAADALRLSAGGDLTASAMTLAGDLSVESFGNAKLTKDMQLSGDVDVTTHGGAITFAALNGAVEGEVTLDARGGGGTVGDVTVQLGGTLNLAGLDARNANVLAKDGIGAEGVATLSGAGTFQTNGGDIALTHADNVFGGELRVVALAPVGGARGDLDLRASGDLTLAQLVGDGALVRAGGDVAQTGDLSLAGAMAIEAGGDIALDRSGNSFGGALSLSGQDAAIGATGPLDLGAATLNSLAVALDGALSQSGALAIDGATAISTAGAAVDLDAEGNRFGGAVSVATDAGGAPVADVALASDRALTLGAVTADALQVDAGGALTQNAALRADGDVTLVSDGLLELNQDNTILGDLDARSQGGMIAITSLAARIDGAMALNARKGGTVGDVQVQIGGVATLGAMNAGAAQIFAFDGIVAPEALRIAGASTFQTRSTDISLTSGANSFGGEVRLLAVATAADPGDVTVASGGDLTLAQLTARSATVSVDGDLTQTGVVSALADSAFSASGDLFLTNDGNNLAGAVTLSGQDVRIATAGDLTLGASSADALTVTVPGALDQVGGVSVAGLMTVDVGASLSLGREDNALASIAGAVAGAEARLRDADGFALVGLDAARLLIGGAGDRQAGDVAIGGDFGAQSAVYTTGDVTIDAGFGASFGDLAALDAGGDLLAADILTIGDDAALTAAEDLEIGALVGGSATLTGRDVTLGGAMLNGALFIAAGNDLRLGDTSLAATSTMSAADLSAGGGAQISALDANGAMRVQAGAGVDLSAISTGGDLIAATDAGDIRLAGVDVGGDFGAHAADGAIMSRAVAGQAAPVLSVTGDARFDAAGAVRLPASDGSGGQDFGGAVAITRASDVAIEASGDLVFGAVDIAFASLDAETTGGIFDRTGNRISGDVHLKSSGVIAAVGAAHLRADGDVRLDADGAATLLGANDVGGAISVSANALDWAELGGIDLADISTDGDARLIAGMDGALGDAFIRQGATATVPVLAMVEGVAQSGQQSFAGPMNVGGDLDLSSGLAADVQLADVVVEVEIDRDVDLGDLDNVFHGAVALRRIAGDAVVVEESGAETLRQDELDGGELHLRQVEVIGDIAATTSDDVIFDGRMTALLDEDVPEAKPSIPLGPSEDDPRNQGLADLAPEDFRLWLSDGATLVVDATAGGVDQAGGMIRFDRPVDGFHDRLPARTLESVNLRAGGAEMRLIAGAGHLRFRDYVGAGAPLGDVTVLSAGDVSLGHTYAGKDPNASSPSTRFLLGRSKENDVFFASDFTVDATGDVVLFAPLGLRDKFETDDVFYGVNLRGLTYGQILRPSGMEAFGFIGGSSRKAAGLYPVGPRAPQYNLNGCVIGDVADCTGVSAPNVLTVLRLDRAQILNVEREDLFELFVSYGNEELWGVPQGYILDLQDLDPGEEDEESQEDEAQVAPLEESAG